MFTQRDDYSETDRAAAIRTLEDMITSEAAAVAALHLPRNTSVDVDVEIEALDEFLARTEKETVS